jgi:hypothetical protein
MDRTKKNLRDIVLVVQPEKFHTIPRYQCEVNILVGPIVVTVGEKEVIDPAVPC